MASRNPPFAFRRPRLYRALRVLATAVLTLALVGGAGFVGYHHRPLPSPVKKHLFQGVDYAREIVAIQTHPVIVHTVTVDVGAEGIGFFVTPGDPSARLPLAARTASDFLHEFHLQVAFNGDFFSPWYSNHPLDFYPRRGDPVAVDGWAISSGVTYAQGGRERTLAFSRDERPSFKHGVEGAYNAVSGEPLLEDGEIRTASAHAGDVRHPRTAIGLSFDEKRLYVIVVDGRQPNYSEGVTLAELGERMLAAGAYNAINLDGGGSTTLVAEGPDGEPVELNSPIHTRIPGRERPVGNHVGIRAKLLDPRVE